MFKKIIKINILLIFFTIYSFADIVQKISIKGNKRLSADSIIVFSKVEIGSDYNSNSLNLILKNLYETNFFKQVTLNVDNNTLIINVIENPIIEDLVINGIKSKKISKLLIDSMILKSRKSYDESIFLKDVNSIKNSMKSSGYYFSDIKTSVIKNEEQNTIRIIYDIDLGEKAKIGEIVFLGDKKIKDRKLKNIITSEEYKFWKFISKTTNLDSERINLDKRLLLNYYKNLGFYNVKINDSFVEFKDNNSFKLIFNIESGKKFTFNKLNLVIPTDYELKYFIPITNLLSKLEKRPYSLLKINKILDEVDKVALSKQYEFIDAALTEKIIDKNKLDITITLSESEKSYVERINILGNEFTLEEVIRNSLIVDEGDPYNEILFNKSVNNLKSKGIFGSVNAVIKEGSTNNFKVIDIIVEEKPTGEMSLGAGLGTSGGSFGGGIKENNFLGKGILLDTNFAISKNTFKGKFIYTKPNFNYTDNTLSIALQSKQSDFLTDYGYKTNNIGFDLGTSFEQYENLYFSPEISTSLETLSTNNDASTNLKKQAGDYYDLYFNYALVYDMRNQRYKASEGYRTEFYQELPLLFDSSEILNSFQITKYKKLPSEMVGKMTFFVQSINSTNNKDVRISKRISVPNNKLRGFESGKVGPVDNNDYIGGNYVSSLNFMTSLPQILPSFQNTDISLFMDAANVWGVDYSNSIDDSNSIRSSIGIAIDFATPVGPLNFSLSQAITKASSDITESFRFNLGTSF